MKLMAELTTDRITKVSRHWFPANGRTGAYGILRFGGALHGMAVYLDTPADVDAVIAELVALRAEMTGDDEYRITPKGEAALDAETGANPPRYVAPGGDRCRARAGNYTCNAQEGHDGPQHVAYGSEGQECHRWPVAPAAARGDRDEAATAVTA